MTYCVCYLYPSLQRAEHSCDTFNPGLASQIECCQTHLDNGLGLWSQIKNVGFDHIFVENLVELRQLRSHYLPLIP